MRLFICRQDTNNNIIHSNLTGENTIKTKKIQYNRKLTNTKI